MKDMNIEKTHVNGLVWVGSGRVWITRYTTESSYLPINQLKLPLVIQIDPAVLAWKENT